MRFYADLHIHSKYSRACSRDCDLEHLTWWAKRKGVTLVGTGDVTHPAWFAHLEENLVPAEPGLFRLRPDLEREVDRTLPPSCLGDVRFMLSVEISTIYKRDERTRKVHHLVYLPDFAAAAEFNRRLGAIGNIGSDGRPILGLDSRDLLEITLECSPDAYLVPAHIWTPWFSVLGSKAGFNAVEDCYLDLAEHVFALETGLSADPEMIWRVSSLDKYRLVSYSDAHSPPMLGREASRFDTDLDYYAVRRALETGHGYLGSVEFFPEEGKYHLDGHRTCQVRLEPYQTRRLDGRCPECGKALTVGVLHRVEELADRPAGSQPLDAAGFTNLIPLPEIVSEIVGVGPKSKKVQAEVAALTAAHGPELRILDEVPLGDLTGGTPVFAEAIRRLRQGEVTRAAGYDGEYGTIRLFEPDELHRLRPIDAPALFDASPATHDDATADTVPSERRQKRGTKRSPAPTSAAVAELSGPAEEATDRFSDGQAVLPVLASAAGDGADSRATGDQRSCGSEPVPALLAGLDAEQRAAASAVGGPLVIVAGPGTGKTRTLTHRLAYLTTERGVPPEKCLAITFTRKAAGEMTERLRQLVGQHARRITVATFHSFGLGVLREQHRRLGLSSSFEIADAARRQAVLEEVLGDATRARDLLPELSRLRRQGDDVQSADPEAGKALETYLDRLRELDLVDLDDLVALPTTLLEADPQLCAEYRRRYQWVCVDEYQDVDALQYRLLRSLVPLDGNITAIGDPDQSIYRFRGADVGFFLRFRQDYPRAALVQLTSNYRSGPQILAGAAQAIRPSTLVPDRTLHSASDHAEAVKIGIHAAADEQGEAAFVARTVDQLLGGSSFHSRDSGRVTGDGADGLGFSDIAVLFRTSAQARPIMDALTRAGYPFQAHTHERLTDRSGVRLILQEMTYASPASKAPDVRTGLQRAADIALNRMPMAEQDERAADLHEAVALLTPLAIDCGSNIERFRAELLLGAEVDALDPRADRISLLTLHAAKGLEFPVVFLVGCEDGLLPFSWPGEKPDDDHLAEERRLFFVGMTRAQQRLFLTYAGERARRGRREAGRPSPFLEALDASVCTQMGEDNTRRKPRAYQPTLI